MEQWAESNKAKVTEESLECYYPRLQAELDKHDFQNRPHHIFNMDETGLQPAHTATQTIMCNSI